MNLLGAHFPCQQQQPEAANIKLFILPRVYLPPPQNPSKTLASTFPLLLLLPACCLLDRVLRGLLYLSGLGSVIITVICFLQQGHTSYHAWFEWIVSKTCQSLESDLE